MRSVGLFNIFTSAFIILISAVILIWGMNGICTNMNAAYMSADAPAAEVFHYDDNGEGIERRVPMFLSLYRYDKYTYILSSMGYNLEIDFGRVFDIIEMIKQRIVSIETL